ncbi:MAG: hypothetical protein V4697_01900 [Patescibacteria group bacterium]
MPSKPTKRNIWIILAAVLIILCIFLFNFAQPLPSAEDYVRENISTLSPVKEQVGGKFFVTEIEANDGSGFVSYEDGHNAYTADFTYTYEEENLRITQFEVR